MEGAHRRRILGRGELPLVVLSLLAERARHGYEIIRAIEERFAGLYTPSAGSIYPLLTMLEDQGFATAAQEDGKRLYAITDPGRAELAANQPVLDAVFARIDLASRSETTREASAEIYQAMRNLRYAVALRAGQSPWTAETAAQVREILEKAATDIVQAGR
jgi:DNA-binding PadR family transcriptional regulator